MASIEQMLNTIIAIEGDEYTNDPDDSGGPTKYGITEEVARAFGYTGDMKDMTVEQAKGIYRQRYWYQPRFDAVATVSTIIAEELFDTAVNMGTVKAGMFLQRSLNVLNNGGTKYRDIEVDGHVGAMTVASLKALIDERGQNGVNVLLRMLNGQQCVRYMEIAESRPKDEKYVFGWIANRVK